MRIKRFGNIFIMPTAKGPYERENRCDIIVSAMSITTE